MIVFRLSKSSFKQDLTGKGAGITGGRWNSRGIRMVYTSQSRALCTAEIAVHTPLGILPLDYWLITLEIPDDSSVNELIVKDLPTDWKKYPHSHSTQTIGDRFIADNRFLVLKVPSAVIQGDFNFLINPSHADITKVKILFSEPFQFDSRLFK